MTNVPRKCAENVPIYTDRNLFHAKAFLQPLFTITRSQINIMICTIY